MVDDTNRRSLLKASGKGLAGFGLVGSLTGRGAASSTKPHLDVNIYYPWGNYRAKYLAENAVDEIESQFNLDYLVDHPRENGLSVSYSSGMRSFSIADYDDRTETVQSIEDSLYGNRNDPDASNTIELIIYEHGQPWEADDEMGGAGFNAWFVGAPDDSADHSDHTKYFSADRQYDGKAGNYSFAFVNAGMLDGAASVTLNSLGYDEETMFAQTVIHEIGHCFNLEHCDGRVRSSLANPISYATPMMTWYAENDAIANDVNCDGYNPEDVLGHTPTYWNPHKFIDHADEYLV